MQVYLIKASAPGPFKDYKKATGSPPQNIFSVAAATPKGIEIDMCDETIGMKPKLKSKANIVAIFFHTPDAPHAYKLADSFKTKGKTVVLGGLHVSFMPDEAANHADTLLIGEAEEIWEELLQDYSAGNLKKRYERDKPIDLAKLKPYPTDIISPAKYGYLWSIVVSRGCPHKCEYCTVPQFFKGKYQLRPIENIVAEIKAAPTDWFELHADNLTANREYALKLFKALAPLNINWFGESTIKMADDEELLQAAADSGCHSLLIGIETPSQAALNETGKAFVTPEEIKGKIDNFHHYGIEVASSMIFGFDTHTNDIFSESEEFCRAIGLDEVEGVILIPFPGTPLFSKLEKENRILTTDWSMYDGSNVVYEPVKMSKDELDNGLYWFWDTIRKNKSIRITSSTNPLTSSSRTRPNKATNSDSNTVSSDTNVKKGESPPSSSSSGIVLKDWMMRQKWKALSGLGLIAIGLVMDWYWIWGILFLVWAINDVRSRRTHLLEDVTRAENPVLYWVIVVLWICLAFYALSSVSVFAGECHPQNVMIEQNTKVIKNDSFEFALPVPANWTITKNSTDKYSQTYTIESSKHTCSVTVVGVKFEAPIELNAFTKEMNKQLAKEIPIIDTTSAITLSPSLDLAESVRGMNFKQYSGKWENHNVTVLVGHKVTGLFGYSLVGMYAKRDKKKAQVVRKTLEQFTIKK